MEKYIIIFKNWNGFEVFKSISGNILAMIPKKVIKANVKTLVFSIWFKDMVATTVTKIPTVICVLKFAILNLY